MLAEGMATSFYILLLLSERLLFKTYTYLLILFFKMHHEQPICNHIINKLREKMKHKNVLQY